MPRAGFIFALASVSLLALAVDARPPGSLPLSLNLNGEATRPTQADGGGLLLSAAGTAVATATVSCGATYKLVCPVTAVNFCSSAPTSTCSSSTSQATYGEAVAAAGFIYFVSQDCGSPYTKTVAAVSQTDAGVDCPLFLMR